MRWVNYQYVRLLALPLGFAVAGVMYFLPAGDAGWREVIAMGFAFAIGGAIALFGGPIVGAGKIENGKKPR